MNKPIEDRIRKIDVTSLPEAEQQKHAEKIKKFVEQKVKQFQDDMKSVLSIYNLESHMLFDIKEAGVAPTWIAEGWGAKPEKKVRKTKEKQVVKEKAPRKSKKAAS